MKYRNRRSFLWGGLFLLIFIMAGSGRGTTTIFQARQVQALSSHRVYLPVIHRTTLIPPAPNSPPMPTTSYYFQMRYYTPAWARNFGCQLGRRDLSLQGKQESVVFLAFGIPKYVSGQYGASGMLVGGFYNVDKIAQAVQEFGIGYWECVGADYESHLRIAIGTNNYNDKETYANLSVTYAHGQAWAQMVNRVASYFVNVCQRSCDGQVSVVGASDIELAWSAPKDAINWVNGYDSANLYPMYNFGAAEGCAYFARPTANCGGSMGLWSKEQVYTVANSGPAYPMPEIYLNSGIHAEQWYLLSVYSKQYHGHPFDFVGVLTTYGACQQSGGGGECVYIDNTPQQGWTQLYKLINGSNLSTWDDLRYSSDILWAR